MINKSVILDRFSVWDSYDSKIFRDFLFNLEGDNPFNIETEKMNQTNSKKHVFKNK